MNPFCPPIRNEHCCRFVQRRTVDIDASRYLRRLVQTHLKAFEMLQLQTQYLLFCHQTMRERHAEVERRLAKLKRYNPTT